MRLNLRATSGFVFFCCFLAHFSTALLQPPQASSKFGEELHSRQKRSCALCSDLYQLPVAEGRSNGTLTMEDNGGPCILKVTCSAAWGSDPNEPTFLNAIFFYNGASGESDLFNINMGPPSITQNVFCDGYWHLEEFPDLVMEGGIACDSPLGVVTTTTQSTTTTTTPSTTKAPTTTTTAATASPSTTTSSTTTTTPSTTKAPTTSPSTTTSSTTTPSTTTPKTTTGCLLGGVWGPWSSGTCSDVCGLCGTLLRARACLSQATGCPCSGASTDSGSVYCGDSLCLYPRPSCCTAQATRAMVNSTIKCALK